MSVLEFCSVFTSLVLPSALLHGRTELLPGTGRSVSLSVSWRGPRPSPPVSPGLFHRLPLKENADTHAVI